MTQGAGREQGRRAQATARGAGYQGGTGAALMVPSAPPGSAVPVGPEAPVMEVLRTMRAMRRLKPDPVPRDLLERLVETATWAPSEGNAQVYSYVVVTEQAQVARLGVLWRDVQSKYLACNGTTGPRDLRRPGRRRDVGGGPVSGGTLRRDPGGDRGVLCAATRSPRSPAGRRPDPGSRPRFPAPHGEPARGGPGRREQQLSRGAEPAARSPGARAGREHLDLAFVRGEGVQAGAGGAKASHDLRTCPRRLASRPLRAGAAPAGR